MQLTSKTFTVLRNLLMAIMVAFAACPAAMAQVTVTNATFPAAGDVLKTAIASNPAIGIAAYSAPGGPQFWDLSSLQPGVLKTNSFQPASQGVVGAQVPGAELFTANSPGSEEYYNVTANKFEIQATYGKFYDVVPNYLAQYSPPMTERNAPMNFFDIYASSTGMVAGSACVPVSDNGLECSFPPSDFPPTLITQLTAVNGGAQAEKLRYRLTINRTEAVDAYGTMSIPGGTYNVLRLKRTEYRETRLDGKYTPLGWIDITGSAITAGFQGLGVDTIVTYFFYNDVVKEPIAVVTFNNEVNATTQVIYKYNAPATPPSLSINDITQNEGNSGATTYTFTVSLSAPAPAGGVTFNIATANNTATTANNDYVAKTLTSQTIPAGSSTYNFSVIVNGDAAVESNETFFVNVTNVTGATISDGQALGTITNDDNNSCTPPVITAPKVKQPTCLVPTGQIGVKATGASTLEYSIDNGVTFKKSATFKNLAVGGYHIVVRLVSSPACSTVYASNPVIINPVPGLVAPTAISGPEGVCRNATGQVFSVAAVEGATSYQWTLPAGATGSSTTNSISLSFNGTYTSGNICVKAINACKESSSFCRQIKYYNAKPATPGAIAGKTIGLCTTQTYSIPAVPDATDYLWVIPANTKIISGQGTPQLELSFIAGFVSGTLSVTASNCKGSSASQSLQLFRNPEIPASITGPVSAVCPGSTKAYSCPLVTGATLYTWKVPAEAVINSGQGTNSISVTFKPAFVSGTIKVASGTSCSSGEDRSIDITSKPSTPSAITGPASVCPSATGLHYSTTSVAGITYNWQVPTGATITAGQGTAVITVNMGTKAGNVKVSASNACSTSTFQSLAVSLLSCTATASTAAKTNDVLQGELIQLHIWPNPASSKLYLQLNGYTSEVTLQLRNLEGKVLRQEKLQAGQAKTAQQKMDIAAIANGIYLLTAINQKGNITTKKVIISR